MSTIETAEINLNEVIDPQVDQLVFELPSGLTYSDTVRAEERMLEKTYELRANVIPSEEEVDNIMSAIDFWYSVVPEKTNSLNIVPSRYVKNLGSIGLSYPGILGEAVAGYPVHLEEVKPLEAYLTDSVNLDELLGIFKVDELIYGEAPDTSTSQAEYEISVSSVADNISGVIEMQNTEHEIIPVAFTSDTGNELTDGVVQEAFERTLLTKNIRPLYSEIRIDEGYTIQMQLAVLEQGRYAHLVKLQRPVILENGLIIDEATVYGMEIDP